MLVHEQHFLHRFRCQSSNSSDEAVGAQDLGADECIDYKHADFVQQLKHNPVDLVFESVGGVVQLRFDSLTLRGQVWCTKCKSKRSLLEPSDLLDVCSSLGCHGSCRSCQLFRKEALSCCQVMSELMSQGAFIASFCTPDAPFLSTKSFSLPHHHVLFPHVGPLTYQLPPWACRR